MDVPGATIEKPVEAHVVRFLDGLEFRGTEIIHKVTQYRYPFRRCQGVEEAPLSMKCLEARTQVLEGDAEKKNATSCPKQRFLLRQL